MCSDNLECFRKSIWRLFCEDCGTPFHRDEMAAHNMVNAAQGHLLLQQRPLYLQEVDENGHYPWMATEMTGDTGDSKDTVINGDTEDKDDQALEGTNITAGSINNCLLDSVPGTSHKASKRKASEEKEQITAILQRTRRPRNE